CQDNPGRHIAWESRACNGPSWPRKSASCGYLQWCGIRFRVSIGGSCLMAPKNKCAGQPAQGEGFAQVILLRSSSCSRQDAEWVDRCRSTLLHTAARRSETSPQPPRAEHNRLAPSLRCPRGG